MTPASVVTDDEVERQKITPDMAKAWLDYETAEPIPQDEGNAAYDKRVRMLKHAFMVGYLAAASDRDVLVAENERMIVALKSIREHCAIQPSPLAKAIVATCDAALIPLGD
jgi:hypothetical protein